MSMIMNHDITALMGQRIMQRNSLAMKRSLEKLSSGLRTKIADVDNTAGLAISETMRARLFGTEKAIYNTQDGISMIQTASGALDRTQNMLRRMRELTVQAANDVLTQQDRSYIQTEINEIRDEITMVGTSTQFNRKHILSGDQAVLWSSTDSRVRAIVKGGLRSIDDYGQKYAVDGNYRISVQTDAGKAQVQKTDIFHIKHDDVLTDENINDALGVRDVYVSGDVPAGSYTVKLTEGDAQSPVVTGAFGLDGRVSDVFSINASGSLDVNASVLFEVRDVRTEYATDEDGEEFFTGGSVTLKATANILTQEGAARSVTMDNIILEFDGSEGSTKTLSGLFGGDEVSITLDDIFSVNEGARFAVNFSAQDAADNAIGLDITGRYDSTAPDQLTGKTSLHYVLDGNRTGNAALNFRNFYVNSTTGAVTSGTITLETDGRFKPAASGGVLNTDEETILADFTASYVGKVADGNTKLRDIDKFWDVDGIFILDQPKELTLTQGDGTQAKVVLYADDTLNDAARKLNDAIATGLGQSKYVDDATKFATYVDGETLGFESVGGTIVLRSVLTGTNGEITLSGNEDLLKALSLNTIQAAKETEYTVTVRDAHDDSLMARNVHITGNRLVGVIHQNIDVELDPMMGLKAAWNESKKNFDLIETAKDGWDEVILHLADNTTIFQTGTSEGEDVMIGIGDMRAHALGLDGVNVMSHDSAARSISLIDDAIDSVSMQQARLGSAQNRLEHHLNNLASETESLTEANSRIRDVDYMSEVLEFAKNRILMDSNTAMLAQTNQIQQTTILSLLR